jgi:hypothetical protein
VTDAAPRIEAGELAEPPIATPDSYERIGRAMLNSGLPALQVQYDVLKEERSLIGCFGSWRSGKTRGGAMRLARAGCSNPWRKIYGRTNPFSFVISETVNVLTDSTLPEMLSVLPREAILRVWEGRGNQRIRLINGHDYVFRTWSGAIEGGSACAVWLDEAHKLDGPQGPEHAWRNYVMRATDTRSQHKVVIATGLPEFGYLSDLFNSPATDERVTYLCSLRDNFYLSKKDMDRLRASCTAEEAEVLIDGNWRKPQNVVYYAFDEFPAPKGNFVKTQGDRGRPVDIAMDLGDLGAILVSQRVSVWGINAQGRRVKVPGVLVVDEYLPTAMGAEEALRAFLRDKSWHLDSSSKIYVDPKASRDQLAAIAKVMGTGRAGGPQLVRQNPKNEAYAREYGYRCANVGFRDANGNRRLFLWSGMPREKRSLLTALRRHRRKPNGQPYRDNIIDHISDCLRYLVADQLPVLEGGGMVVHKRAA